MVSMYVDIRQAAELLAKFSTGHRLSHVAIELANEIRAAARQGGLQFYTQYRDPIDGLMHVSDPANILGASFSIAEDEKGKRYVKPNGYTEGENRKSILQSQGWPDTPEPHDGEWVAYCVVSIEDVVKHPCFGFPKEKQDRIIEAHKAAAVALLPVEDDAPVVKEKPEDRRARWLDMFEAEEKREKRGALQRLADSENVDRSNMKKDIDKARGARDAEKRAGTWTSQLVQDGKRPY